MPHRNDALNIFILFVILHYHFFLMKLKTNFVPKMNHIRESNWSPVVDFSLIVRPNDSKLIFDRLLNI